MPVLYLLRHAKSTWENPDLSDHDRPLNERGRNAAPLIGKWLRDNAPALDLALVSSATRALETWKLVAAELKTRPAVTIDRSFYLAGQNQLALGKTAGDILSAGYGQAVQTATGP